MMPFCAEELKHSHQNINIFQWLFTIATNGRFAAGFTKFRFVSLLGFDLVGIFHFDGCLSTCTLRDVTGKGHIYGLPSEELRSSRVGTLRFHRCRTHSPEPKHLMGCTATLSLALSSPAQDPLLYSWLNKYFFLAWPDKTGSLAF